MFNDFNVYFDGSTGYFEGYLNDFKCSMTQMLFSKVNQNMCVEVLIGCNKMVVILKGELKWLVSKKISGECQSEEFYVY